MLQYVGSDDLRLISQPADAELVAVGDHLLIWLDVTGTLLIDRQAPPGAERMSVRSWMTTQASWVQDARNRLSIFGDAIFWADGDRVLRFNAAVQEAATIRFAGLDGPFVGVMRRGDYLCVAAPEVLLVYRCPEEMQGEVLLDGDDLLHEVHRGPAPAFIAIDARNGFLYHSSFQATSQP